MQIPIAARWQPARSVPTASALTFADGMAVRVPDMTALDVIRRGADRMVEVSDNEIAEAIRVGGSCGPVKRTRAAARSGCGYPERAEHRSELDANRPGRGRATR